MKPQNLGFDTIDSMSEHHQDPEKSPAEELAEGMGKLVTVIMQLLRGLAIFIICYIIYNWIN